VLAATSIWFVKVWNATEVLRAALVAGRYPVSAYPVALRTFFTFVLPVAFLTTVPAEAILGRGSAPWLLASLAVAAFCLLGSPQVLAVRPALFTPRHRVDRQPGFKRLQFSLGQGFELVAFRSPLRLKTQELSCATSFGLNRLD